MVNISLIFYSNLIFFLGVARILKSFISTSFEIWESYLWLRNIKLVVAYIRWPVPGGPYLTV
jgi:hypothetical protein